MRRTLSALVVLTLFAACGGRAEVFADRGPGQRAERGVTLPDPIPAAPVFAISSDEAFDQRMLERLRKVDGVAVAAPVSIRKMAIEGALGKVFLRVGGIAPLEFRSVTPGTTRDAEFVWVSLIVGQAVPTFDAARRLGLSGEGEIEIAGTGYSVGAFADNGVPNIADVLVQNGDEKYLGLGRPRTVVIGAKSGVTIEALQKDLEKVVPDARFKRLIPQSTVPAQQTGSAPQPVGHVQGGVIGSMTFQIMENGFIRPDPSWVAANIVSASVPIFGTVTCHRLMIPRLRGALEDVVEAGLADEIRPNDYGGCYVPRFIDRDPGKPLSNHAFGLAVDFNVSTNQLGTRGDMHPGIVEIFQRWGFTWGGYWSRPDPMHFEL
ncbi:MAG: M15 family metallopeptidase [Actinomycetota bacterium]